MHLPEETWQQACRVLADARTVVLTCHVQPDGDGLGSMLALGLALERLGRVPVCSWDAAEPQLPRSCAFLPGRHLLRPPAEVPAAPDALVVLDSASPERLGVLARLLDTAAHVLVLDHHPHGAGLPGIQLVDPAAAATGVIAEELVRRLGVALDREIATCVYTALTTDTGSFKYQATTPAVHELAGRLLATGIPHADIARAVWDTAPFGYLGLLARVLERARLEPEALRGRGLVWTYTTVEDLDGLTYEDTEGVIDVVRTAVEADVAVVCKSDPDGTVNVSVRSKGGVDVGAACLTLGGGGHRYAAGYRSALDVPTTMARLRGALERSLDEA